MPSLSRKTGGVTIFVLCIIIVCASCASISQNRVQSIFESSEAKALMNTDSCCNCEEVFTAIVRNIPEIEWKMSERSNDYCKVVPTSGSLGVIYIIPSKKPGIAIAAITANGFKELGGAQSVVDRIWMKQR